MSKRTFLLGVVGGILVGAYLAAPFVTAPAGGLQTRDFAVVDRAEPDLRTVIAAVVWWCAVLAVGTLVAVVVHELGHLAVGSAFGFAPLYLLAGPLMIDMGGTGLRFGRNPMRRYLPGAVFFMPPPASDNRMTKRWCCVAAAGPAANVLFGLVLLGLVASPVVTGGAVGPLVGIGSFNVAIGLLNVLPIRRFGLSDGAVIAALVRGDQRAARLIQGMRFGRWVMSPTAPADWPDDLVAEAEAAVAAWPMHRPLDQAEEWLGALQVLFYRYAERGSHAALRDLLLRLAAAPRSDRQRRLGTLSTLDVWTAVCLAAWADDPFGARVILQGVPERAPIRANSLWHAAWAAVYLGEGDRAGASAEARRALTLLRRFGLHSGADQAEQRWIENILAKSASVDNAGSHSASTATLDARATGGNDNSPSSLGG